MASVRVVDIDERLSEMRTQIHRKYRVRMHAGGLAPIFESIAQARSADEAVCRAQQYHPGTTALVVEEV